MQALLQTVPIGVEEWMWIGGFALPVLIVPEVLKALRPRFHRTK